MEEYITVMNTQNRIVSEGVLLRIISTVASSATFIGGTVINTLSHSSVRDKSHPQEREG